jgi:hypothetical protein
MSLIPVVHLHDGGIFGVVSNGLKGLCYEIIIFLMAYKIIINIAICANNF